MLYEQLEASKDVALKHPEKEALGSPGFVKAANQQQMAVQGCLAGVSINVGELANRSILGEQDIILLYMKCWVLIKPFL